MKWPYIYIMDHLQEGKFTLKGIQRYSKVFTVLKVCVPKVQSNLNTMNSQLLSLPPPTLRMEPLESSQYIHPSIASSSQTFTPNQSFLPSQSTLPHQQMLWRPSLPTCHQPVNHLQYYKCLTPRVWTPALGALVGGKFHTSERWS